MNAGSTGTMAGTLRSPLDVADAVAKAHRGGKNAKQTGEDFEAVFLTQMFNEMLSTVGEGPLGAGPSAGVWRSFLADEYAKSFAKAGGIGIGTGVYRTLLAQQEVGT